jgi:potassium efflux system protein
MRALRSLLITVGIASVWPAYLALMAYTVRIAPIPRSLARPGSFALGYLAVSLFIAALARFLLGSGGWAEETLGVPARVARQLKLVAWSLAAAGVLFLLPNLVLLKGLIAPDDRPVRTPALCRLFTLAFEITVWFVIHRLVRRRSALMQWLLEGAEHAGWVGRHHRLLAWSLLVAVGAVIGLDAQGYAFTARRVAIAGGQATILVLACWAFYKLIGTAIDHHAWRWIKTSVDTSDAARTTTGRQEDLAGRLRRLTAIVIPIFGLLIGAWLWNFDTALFRYVSEVPLWGVRKEVVTVGNLAKSLIILAITAFVWRHLNDVFAVTLFPRMPEDPGVRFAVLTLCRYLVLGVGLLSGLSAVHLGLDQIGVVLAALGVGLGFGLQEIVSNFVSGIILLLERPIRVGDVVTVANMTGRVDRINIRATTIINADNQSMIVPNREFITANLVNWTHKDRIVRVSIELRAAYGNDPDRVSELLLAIAREDDEVLCNPLPSAAMTQFGDSALVFTLHVFVADPSLAGRVRHRLCGQIQARFKEAGIEIPLPAREYIVRTLNSEPSSAFGETLRIDPASHTPPAPRFRQQIPAPVEPSHRGVDE